MNRHSNLQPSVTEHFQIKDRFQPETSVDELVRRYNAGESAFSLATEQGIRIQSLFQRFRRGGYRWDVCRGCYTRTPLLKCRGPLDNSWPERAIQVLLQCRGVKADRLSVALRMGFSSVQCMDRYMNEFGYRWYEYKHMYAPVINDESRLATSDASDYPSSQ